MDRKKIKVIDILKKFLLEAKKDVRIEKAILFGSENFLKNQSSLIRSLKIPL